MVGGGNGPSRSPVLSNRYKVSVFGRDRAVALHRAEVREDPQYGRRVHELSGKRLLCHFRQNEKCHADNLRDLFRDRRPHAFDPRTSERPPLSSELNILSKGREDREDSEESGLKDAEANAPQGWQGTGKPLVIGSGYVERRLCDGQGLCSPGVWAPEDRQYASSQLWPTSPDCSWERLNPSPQFSSCQNSLWAVSRGRRSVEM